MKAVKGLVTDSSSSQSSPFGGWIRTNNKRFVFSILTTLVMYVVTVFFSQSFLHLGIMNGESGFAKQKVSVGQYGHGYNLFSDDDDNLQTQTLDEESNSLLDCRSEYKYIKRNQSHGLKEEDYSKSRAFHGGIRRLSIFLEKLQLGKQPVTVVSYGGSISNGHGVEPATGIYSNAFVDWLNQYYPVTESSATNSSEIKTHTLVNHAKNGADVSLSRLFTACWLSLNCF
jgi:hypothetical protein